VKLPDTNVLLYAVNSASAQHTSALHWLRRALEEPAGVGFAWVSLLGFLRISTRAGILARPLLVSDALRAMRFWLEQPRARLLHPGERHADLIEQLLTAAGTGGNLTTDAHLAALAMEHGATLASFDADFERFQGLSFERLRVPN
jgi:toxin-antitoxin system PIN domain toxin